MYIEQDPVPVLEAQRFSRPMQRWQPQGVQYAGLGAMFNRPSMRMMRPRGAIGPTWLLAGLGAAVNPLTLSLPGGGLTPTQQKLCAAAKSKLANLPWVASPECGICPPPSDVSCPTPEEQGYILPESCPTGDCVEKEGAAAGGLAWWWILVAAAGGLVVGATAGYYSAKKPGPKVI